jgi:predicted O-methyltransferase YrrM
MNKTIDFTPELYEYLLAHNLNEHPVQTELRARTAEMPEAGLQIAAEQAAFMQFLVASIRAERALEVGVFTGYSSLAVALAMPRGGQVVACDISEEYTTVAREFWEKAGVASMIDLRIAPALETLDALVAGGEEGTFDFAFIDADKGNYPVYYERCMDLVRSGGIIAVDNTLWAGRIHEEARPDSDAEAIRSLNRRVYEDKRVVSCLVNVGDGMLLATKK